ncbi:MULTISPECIES: hypothetical protein [unclassified Microcystis]|jgi:hypothetical protein|uniref:hypothetical protein n=1 Tax=unclassified Microcystis TaxID=2643300 RepID=UPI0022CCC040|nr:MULTISPECIES: hypothetical protein [unclassified Microcystis]MCA2691590.1 hypothetical protein [Microcystis sp. M034S2]MCA2750494.1 hypothetical protein [Microcystis sp. M144S2]MCZ8202069.1 hypothetical protein [Microcystis sp. LE19-55.1A]MCZ8307407.1 hypothetical protein [Microcystis sp. LE19-98.1E]
MFRTLATDKITIVISHRLALCQAELMSKRGQYHPNSYQSKKPGLQGRLNCRRNPTLGILVQFPSLAPE